MKLMARVGHRIVAVLDSFSVGLLMRTLFSPFKQISAGAVQGPADVKMRAFGDRLFSRIFGAVIRSVFIMIGLVGAMLAALLGLVQITIWPLVPVLPLVGLALTLIGWAP